MVWLVVVGLVLLLCFGGVVFVGAPYLPTLDPQVQAALELVALKSGETLLELGCGDGKVLVAAAEQGLKVVGYELNPLLAAIAWLRTRRYRKRVKVVWGNFWTRTWPPTEGIFTFLLPKYMPKLDNKITQLNNKSIKLVSFAFKIPNREIKAEKAGVYLYEYK
ncbi:MAG TPA: methyltransferase domain-containing protein [Candidatus Saccharimonadales bacterium]|nr:methyltransferase domain-containing protein [Candidatus Saccharimonadales bacterium]